MICRESSRRSAEPARTCGTAIAAQRQRVKALRDRVRRDSVQLNHEERLLRFMLQRQVERGDMEGGE